MAARYKPPFQTIVWHETSAGDGLRLLDQTKLPTEETFLDCATVDEAVDAIKRLVVRGAPAIGVAAAYGVVLAIPPGSASRVLAVFDDKDPNWENLDWLKDQARAAADKLAQARPTAVNLMWATARMKRAVDAYDGAAFDFRPHLVEAAQKIHAEDAQLCEAMGEHVAALIEDGTRVLTICNTGALATAGIGTAASGFYVAKQGGREFKVYALETRPLLQGARLTTWELMKGGIDVTLATDGMAGMMMQRGMVDLVITGADRIAANGDAANKIGTYGLSVLARAHKVPFVVVAPTTTFDSETPTGADIPIEERDPAEVTNFRGTQTAPDGCKAYTPAFDVTPAANIAAIISEKGPIELPTAEKLKAHLG